MNKWFVLWKEENDLNQERMCVKLFDQDREADARIFFNRLPWPDKQVQLISVEREQ